jgi:hypothetical protein
MLMNWVGILLVRGTRYYLNGRLVSQSHKGFLNYAYMAGLPIWLIVYTSTLKEANPQAQFWVPLNRWVTYYDRLAPWVYRPRLIQGYLPSILIGVFVSLCIMAGLFSHRSSVHFFDIARPVNEYDMVAMATSLCSDTDCLRRMSVYPDQVWIELTTSPKAVPECQSIRDKVVACDR